MSDRNVQGAISDLAALKPNWTLLADTIPAEFLRQVKGEIESLTAERDGYLATIRATFRVLESRGQAPDDNAPLSVTVRRVLDYLDRVTAERDALAEQLAALKRRVADARTITLPNVDGWFLLFPMNDGEIMERLKLEDGEN